MTLTTNTLTRHAGRGADALAMGQVEIRHGRAWIDTDSGVRIGWTLAEPVNAGATSGPTSGDSGNDRATVMLLHGAPQTSHAWRKVVVPLAAAGYRVIAPDFRGAGASTRPPGGYDKATMSADLHALIHNVLDIDGPVSVVGHDLGSMLALGYALRYRDDVVSLTTMEAPLPGSDYYEERKVAKSAWHFDFHSNPDIAVHLVHGRERWYIQRFYDDLAYQPGAITESDIDVYARAFEAPGAIRALCEIYRELDHDAKVHRASVKDHGKLTAPVLATGGGAQSLAANYGPMCRDVAENVTTELIPDAGHWVPEEQPEALIDLFLRFDTDARRA
ncbi:alpha/beta fold hydrolase [Nocardioides alkalitolerans]|uniref:alpha/beta fold hydrolase n=1 Tax=Nocardioides alkalitolerans TaxID=281714 RepID=UPI000A0527D2|nr:alpha/beta hydrolase [Nocardioides alkalitolerans]